MKVETSVTFAAHHPVFAGHFPGRPIVPGALLLDEVVHMAMQASRLPQGAFANETAEEPKVRCQIAWVKFVSPVLPGEALLISCMGGAQHPTRFDITCQGRQVATGTFVLEAAQ